MQERDEELTEVVESRDQHFKPRENSRSISPGEISNDKGESDGEEEEGMIGPDIGLAFRKQREEWEVQEELNKQRT